MKISIEHYIATNNPNSTMAVTEDAARVAKPNAVASETSRFAKIECLKA